jgi:integrase
VDRIHARGTERRDVAGQEGSAGLYDFEEYERLVGAAKAMDRNAYLIALLGGEAGLRCGEIMALEWGDVDLSEGTGFFRPLRG